MANRIRIRRSAVPGKIPTVSDVELGELAVNTYDGKAFLKKDNGTESIVTLGTVTSVSGGTGVSVTSGTTTAVVSLSNTGVASGIYGSASQVPVITVDAQGRIIAVSGVAISAGGTSLGLAVALG